MDTAKVKVLHAPQYPNITVSGILDQIGALETAKKYIPERKEAMELPRQYLLDVFYSVEGEVAKKWVEKLCEAHYGEQMDTRNEAVYMTDKVAAAFKKSKHVSSKSMDTLPMAVLRFSYKLSSELVLICILCLF